MLIVRGQKKLRDRMKGAPQARDDDVSTTGLGDWFATALFWKPQVAMLVNTRTMLPVFLALAPTATLLDRIPAAIAEVLGRHGVPAAAIEAELAQMSDVRLAPTNDRRVLGVMNEFVFQAEHWSEARPDLVGLSLRMSKVILGPLMKSEGTPAGELATIFAPDAKIIAFPGTHNHRVDDSAADHSAGSDSDGQRGQAGRVHQLKVTLRDIRPPVWRRVVVEGTEPLYHLHEVIQAAFGWYNSHLHMFDVDGTDYGIPHEDDWTPVTDERQVSIDQVIGSRLTYSYDFGDGWMHDVVLEKTFEAGADDAPVVVPDCTGGRRACPPEDCGGPWGYEELLAILADPEHPEHEERSEWVGGRFDPEQFDPSTFAQDLDVMRNSAWDDF